MVRLRNAETNVRVVFLKRGPLWHFTAEGKYFNYNIYDA